MNLRPVVLLFLVALPASAAPDVAAANQKLANARKSLDQAVERIKPDPPSNADLDAAHAAVEALKDAIDTGAELEQSDLEYAKAALAARKELRTQREYVDQRRANVKIFDARRGIDAALKPLAERVTALKGKEPTAKEFDDARAAVGEVKKVVDGAREFGKQDPKFATYVTQTDATLAGHLKAIDERQLGLAVEKQKAVLDEARNALKTATGSLQKGAADAEFQAGDKAATELGKRLEEGKALEAKAKPYQTEADKARAELAAAKKKMDQLWSDTGLARLKAEVDPAFKDLQTAGRPLHGKPSADQIAEARTAAIVVRGLVEKFAAEAQRSQAFGQYMEGVKRTLADVESQIEQRNLGAAQLEVVVAQRAIEKANPSDEQFDVLNAAIGVLEKTLGTVHQQEPQMAKPVGEATWVLKGAKDMWAKRRLEVDVQRQTQKVEEAKKIANEQIKQLQSTLTKESIQQAEGSVKLVGTVLEPGTPLVEKDKNYAWYDKDAKQKIAEMTATIAAKKVLLSSLDAKTALNDLVNATKTKIDAAKSPEGKDSDVDASAKSVDELNKMLEGQAALEKQNAAYAAAAEKARNALFGLTDNLEFAKVARDLRKHTGEAYAAGAAAADQAAGLSDLRARKAQFTKGIGLFKSCQSDGQTTLQMYPQLSKLPVVFEGGQKTPREVMAACGLKIEATEQLMKDILPLIKFEDGPKKSYEAGKGLLDKGKKPEALAQYNECIATGVILRNDNPELTDKSFDVAGKKMTLGELIKECAAQRKALSGK